MYVSHLRGGGGTLRSHLTDLDHLDTNRGGHLGGGREWALIGMWRATALYDMYMHAHMTLAPPSWQGQTASRLRARLGPIPYMGAGLSTVSLQAASRAVGLHAKPGHMASYIYI